MDTAEDFVFYDNSNDRWTKIRKVVLRCFLIFEILLFIILGSIVWEPFFSKSILESYSVTAEKIIDEISMTKEKAIEVKGDGFALNLKKEKLFYLERINTNINQSNNRLVLLTFDDGPDPVFTRQVLAVLKQKKVKAIFFVLGEQVIRHPGILNDILRDGHEIGVHTYSHVPEVVNLYKDKNRTDFEIDFTQKAIIAQTGYQTKLFRPPYWGAEDTITLNSLILSTKAIDKGYRVIPPNVDSKDWMNESRDKIVQESFAPLDISVVLLHDAGGDRSKTVESLIPIIDTYRSQGYRFTTTQEIFGKSFKVISSASLFDRTRSHLAVSAFIFKEKFLDYFAPIFELNLGLVTTYMSLIVILSFVSYFKSRVLSKNTKYSPKVTVIIPAHNEEEVITKSIWSVLNSNYKKLELIIVNNKSRDKTYNLARKFVKKGKVRLFNENKLSKSNALNRGIKYARGDIVVVLDADSQVTKNAISEIVKPFKNKKIGAVSGNINVGNHKNFLTWFQKIEYVVNLNIDRRAFSLFGISMVIPGAIGAWRKSAINKLGGFKRDTITEDAELTVRLQLEGYKVAYAPQAQAFTEAPSDLSDFVKQRYRWTYGMLQTLFKYRKCYFRSQHGLLTRFLLPYNAFVVLPFAVLSPVFDFITFNYMVWVSPRPILDYLVLFLVIFAVLVIISFVLSGEKSYWLIFLIPLYRTVYQFIWYFILYKSLAAALKGVFVPWTKSIHYGSFDLYGKISNKYITVAKE